MAGWTGLEPEIVCVSPGSLPNPETKKVRLDALHNFHVPWNEWRCQRLSSEFVGRLNSRVQVGSTAGAALPAK